MSNIDLTQKLAAIQHTINVARFNANLNLDLLVHMSPLERLYIALYRPALIPHLDEFVYPNHCVGVAAFGNNNGSLIHPMDLKAANEWAHVVMRDYMDHPGQNLTGKGLIIHPFPMESLEGKSTFIDMKQLMASAVLNANENICWLPDIDLDLSDVPDVRLAADEPGDYRWGVSAPVVRDVWSHHDAWNQSYHSPWLILGVCDVGNSVFEMICGDDTYTIPDRVVIEFDSRLNHAIRRISGSGAMVCVIWSKTKLDHK